MSTQQRIFHKISSEQGAKMIGINESLIWSSTMMEMIFNTCGEFRWSPEDPVSQIQSPHLHAGVPGIFLDILSSIQMLKSESGVRKATGSYRIYPSLVTLQPWFLSLRWAFEQNCGLGSWFCSERPALGQNTLMMTNSEQLFLNTVSSCYT